MNIEEIRKKIDKYKNMNLNDINPEEIPDIKDLKIDKRKTKEERLIDLLKKVENPYVFKVNGHLVQIGFTNNGKSAEDCLTNVLSSLYR